MENKTREKIRLRMLSSILLLLGVAFVFPKTAHAKFLCTGAHTEVPAAHRKTAAKLRESGIQSHVVTYHIQDPLVDYLGSSTEVTGFRITGGNNWLGQEAQKLAALKIGLEIDPDLKGHKGIVYVTAEGPVIAVSADILDKAGSGVFYHERVHALHNLESLPDFRPEFKITLLSKNRQIKIPGYETYVITDEHEAFREGALRSFTKAQDLFEKKQYEEAFEHITNASTELYYSSISEPLKGSLNSLKERLKNNEYKLNLLHPKWVVVERLASSDVDTAVAFRIDTHQPKENILKEISAQIESRLKSFENSRADRAEIKKKIDELQERIVPIVKELRGRAQVP